MKLRERLALCWRVLRYKPGNLMAHAERELPGGVDPELKELILVFSSQGHSGGSASVTIELLGKLLSYEQLGPLFGTQDEWFKHGQDDDLWEQNKRCSHVFRRKDGTAYDINAVHFRDPDGVVYHSWDSRRDITFPYTPSTVVVDR